MLPRFVLLLSYTGLIPFLIGPAWMTLAPASVPPWLDHVWVAYVAMIAAFMAGTFWGFAMPASEGPAGQIGIVIATVLMLATWGASTLPLRGALIGLALVFALQLLADFWRERTLGEVEGYFRLRAILTVGACVSIAWRWMLGD